MTVWYPPTPPQGEGDIYIDSAMGYLYDWNIMSESQLPPVYIRKDNKRLRIDAGLSPDSRRPSKSHRREESVYAPRSLFERPAPALIKMRRDLKLQKYRSVINNKPPIAVTGIKPTMTPTRPQHDQNVILGWTLLEDKCLLDAVKSQGLPLNLTIVSPAHIPNWDLVADMVNNLSRIYRPPRQCRYRYENEILPREEGKSFMDAAQKKKKSKSHKSGGGSSSRSSMMRTSHLYEQDNNVQFTKDTVTKYDIFRTVFNKKTTTPKRRYDDPNVKNANPKHVAALADYGANYDCPLNPVDVAAKRVERIAKEKQKIVATVPTAAAASATTVIATEQIAAAVPARLQNTVKVPPSPPLVASTVTTATVSASPRPPQRIIQTTDGTRPQRIVVGQQQALVKAGTMAGGKSLNQAQLQYVRQQALVRQQLKVFQTTSQQGNIVQQIGVSPQGTPNKLTPVTLTSIQVSSPQQRPQLSQTTTGVGKQTIARAVTEVEFSALIKRQQAALAQQKGTIQQPVTQIFTSQQQLQAIPGGSGERVAVTLAGGSGVANVVATGVTKVTGTGLLTGVATAIPGKTPMKTATPQQLRQLQLQQQLALAQKRGQKVAQLTQVSGGTQVIVQTPTTHKALPPGMTMQQIQQVMRQIPQGGARVVPRQTIQVVGSGVGQVRTTVPTSHPVILSQVSATLQARQPAPGTSATGATVTSVRTVTQTQQPPDAQSKS